MTDLVIDRILTAAPDRVWRALTTDELVAWLWPPGWQTTGTVDAVPGGAYRLHSPVAEMGLSGEFLEVEAPHRIVQTWRWDGDEHASLVTMTLTPVPEGTALRIVHARLVDDEDRAQHGQGWNDCLDRLPGHLAAG